MKHKILLGAMLIALSASAQSDITLDKCYLDQTVGIHHVNIINGDTVAGCFDEFGFVQGDNEILHIGTRLFNMGPDDASFQGLGYFDECHGHIHLPEVLTFKLYDECGNQVNGNDSKQGFNIQDGANFMQWILSGGNECDRIWLQSFGSLDSSLALNGPNPDFNGSDRMGLSAGFYDTYGALIYGNGIVLNTYNVPNGNYCLVVEHSFGSFINQGLNTYPDQFTLPITISGMYPASSSSPRTVTLGWTPDNYSVSDPSNVQGSVSQGKYVTLDWQQSGTATQWIIQKYVDRGQNAGQASGAPLTVNSHPVQLTPGKGWWKFSVKAVNCTSTSQEIFSPAIHTNK